MAIYRQCESPEFFDQIYLTNEYFLFLFYADAEC